MKNLIESIKEGLKINSKTKVEATKEKKIANVLDIDLKYAKEIHDKYLNMNFLEMDKDFANDLVSASATQFELIFMLCAMLVQDKMLISHFTQLGTKGYKFILHGTNNPYDYSWFEEEIEDEDGNTWDILEYIQEQYKKRKDVEKNIQDAFNFCKEAKIDDPDKIWNFYEEY